MISPQNCTERRIDSAKRHKRRAKTQEEDCQEAQGKAQGSACIPQGKEGDSPEASPKPQEQHPSQGHEETTLIEELEALKSEKERW